LSQLCDAFITKFVISVCYRELEMRGKHQRGPIDSAGARSLILDHLDLDPMVARRLSPAVASRHHALPVAVKDHRVTVVMADPTDAAALEAVASELGCKPYVVQGDRTSIDRLLAQLWHKEGQNSSRLLAYAPADSRADEIESYAEYLGDLLNASLEYVPGEVALDMLVEKTRHDYELVIMGKPDESFGERLFSRLADRKAVNRLPVSLLIAQRPCWPLRKLLLVIQGNTSDHQATDWTLRLAAPSGASVTALAVVPPVPAMYHGLARMERGLAELLTTDTTLGRQMRQVARQLVDGQVEGTLRLRQGSPDWEIQREAVEGLFDLLVIAAAPQRGMRRWSLGDLAVSLMRAVNRPVLIAK
jgi:nucleotide-binding universal stress UspA family protein